MLGINQINNAHWVNDARTRIQALVTYEDGTSELLSVAATEGNPFWEYIKDTVGLEELEQNTIAIIADQQERRKLENFRQQERDIQKKQNAIFNVKIEAFDMIEVANASSARKTKIRKAKSVTEVMAHVALCVIEYEQSQGK